MRSFEYWAIVVPVYALLLPVVYKLISGPTLPVGTPIIGPTAETLVRSEIVNAEVLCPGKPATTAEQREIFNQFVQTFYVEQQARKAFMRHVPENYIQHNPDIPQGRRAVIEDFMGPLFEAGANTTMINTIVGDNRAVAHHRSFDFRDPRPWYIIDIYRFDGTCMSEHWDTMQHMPENPVNSLAGW